MKAEREGKTPYTEKINKHVWMVYRGKDFIKKFAEHIKDEVKWLYAKFPQQPMTEIIDALKREHEAAEKCHICFKEFAEPENRKVRAYCHYTSLYREAAHNNCNIKD